MDRDFGPVSMTLLRFIMGAAVLVFAFVTPALAQVEKAAMKTTGVSCGTCAIFSEVYLRRLPEIATVSISLSREAVMVSYKPGSRFRPKDLRDALKKTDVGVVQVQISARGRVVDEGGRRVFVAGLDRFVVDSVADGQLLPADALVLIEGIVNDQANPMDLKVLTAKPVKP